MQSKNGKKPNLRWYDPILINILMPLLALFVKIILVTYRCIKVEGSSREKEILIQTGGRVIYCTWHQRIFYFARYLGFTNLTIMVSQSRDGEYACRLAKSFGVDVVRGSSTRGGHKALENLTEEVKDGKSAGMLLDGPIGPARVAKIGTIIMAHRTGVPIIPAAWGADRCWVLNSWDRFMIPKPFARVVVCLGEPIRIPGAATGEELEVYRKLLEDRLNEICRRCDEELGQERPWRKVTKERMPETGPYIPSRHNRD